MLVTLYITLQQYKYAFLFWPLIVYMCVFVYNIYSVSLCLLHLLVSILHMCISNLNIQFISFHIHLAFQLIILIYYYIKFQLYIIKFVFFFLLYKLYTIWLYNDDTDEGCGVFQRDTIMRGVGWFMHGFSVCRYIYLCTLL